MLYCIDCSNNLSQTSLFREPIHPLRTWVRLPDAPYAILSSAVVASPSEICILGGWSKMPLALERVFSPSFCCFGGCQFERVFRLVC